MSSTEGKNGVEVGLSNASGANGDESPSNQNGHNVTTNGSSVAKPSPIKQKSPLKESDASSSDTSFEKIDLEDAAKENTLAAVIQKMLSKQYNISENQEDLIFGKCKGLFEKDSVCALVHNRNYSVNYPTGIIVPLKRKSDPEESSMHFDVEEYSKLVEGAPEARLRSRFVAPVMLFDNKFICRSGTLTVKLSACYEMATKTSPSPTSYEEDAYGVVRSVSDVVYNLGSLVLRSITSLVDWSTMGTLFASDVAILNHLKVERICDLMVEYSKLFKMTISVSATEKVHEDLYKDFKIDEMPFPGCEFFVEYHEAGRNAKDLFFNWDQTDVTRVLKPSEDLKATFPEINVDDHKSWDLIQLTQNYLKILLSSLLNSTGGMLVHCISGWDRTPLFVTLLRLSLWADGVIHENLQYEDMAYLTVAYDWFLFGHNLPNRIQKKEEVMHFCFNFLEHITTDEFSITRLFQELPVEMRKNRAFPEFVPGRRVVLNKVRQLVLSHYDAEKEADV